MYQHKLYFVARYQNVTAETNTRCKKKSFLLQCWYVIDGLNCAQLGCRQHHFKSRGRVMFMLPLLASTCWCQDVAHTSNYPLNQ